MGNGKKARGGSMRVGVLPSRAQLVKGQRWGRGAGAEDNLSSCHDGLGNPPGTEGMKNEGPSRLKTHPETKYRCQRGNVARG